MSQLIATHGMRNMLIFVGIAAAMAALVLFLK